MLVECVRRGYVGGVCGGVISIECVEDFFQWSECRDVISMECVEGGYFNGVYERVIPMECMEELFQWSDGGVISMQ